MPRLSKLRDVAPPFVAHTTACNYSLAYPTLARLRESAEKRVWQQRRGLVVTHCYHSILCIAVPAKRQKPISVIIDMLY